jgi:FGGY family of carbohydrate kinases, C-terminal domain
MLRFSLLCSVVQFDAPQLNILPAKTRFSSVVFKIDVLTSFLSHQVKELIDSMDLNNTSSMGGRLRSASLDLLRSASLDLLKSSSISLLKCVANSSNSASDSVAQHLKVGGGMTSNNLLMQFQADLLGLSLYRPYVRTASYTIFIFSSVPVFFFSFFLLCLFSILVCFCRLMPCPV